MPSILHLRGILSLLALASLFLGGCSSLEPSRRAPAAKIHSSEFLLRQARSATNAETAAGLYLAAIQDAAKGGVTNSGLQSTYNAAVAGLVETLKADPKLWNHRQTYTGPDGRIYRLEFPDKKADWAPGYFDELQSIRHRRPRTHAQQRLTRDGWGAIFMGIRKASPERRVDEPFIPLRGYHLPVTALVEMKPGRGGVTVAQLRLVKPDRTPSITLDGKSHEVAADMYTPYRQSFRGHNTLMAGLRWLLRADRFEYPTHLIFLEPYDPDRIPVVLVHGLVSTPIMWNSVVERLSAEPDIRKHYQFWFFFYPTGAPIPITAGQLRKDLHEAEVRYGLDKGVILVGHSMGGILSRAQMSSSGGMAIFNEVFGEDAPRIAQRLPQFPELRNALVFEANPKVRRGVFICAPHRGSNLALMGPAGWAAGLIRLPGRLVDMVESFSDILTQDFSRIPTSIQSLSPKSRFLVALDRRPINGPHHSIIGDRGRGDTPNSSDGIVPFWSSHLPSAKSEVIVPADHGAFRHRKAVEELKRILREDMGENGR